MQNRPLNDCYREINEVGDADEPHDEGGGSHGHVLGSIKRVEESHGWQNVEEKQNESEY